MPPQNLNDQDNSSQAPPPRYGPSPGQPIIPVKSETEQNQTPAVKRSKAWILVLVVVILAVTAGFAYFMLVK